MRKRYQLAGLASFVLAVTIGLTAVAQTSSTTTPPPQAPAQSQAGSTGNASQDRAQAQGEDENPLNLTDEQRQKLHPTLISRLNRDLLLYRYPRLAISAGSLAA